MNGPQFDNYLTEEKQLYKVTLTDWGMSMLEDTNVFNAWERDIDKEFTCDKETLMNILKETEGVEKVELIELVNFVSVK